MPKERSRFCHRHYQIRLSRLIYCSRLFDESQRKKKTRPKYSVAAPWLALVDLVDSAAVVLWKTPALREPEDSFPTRNAVLPPDL